MILCKYVCNIQNKQNKFINYSQQFSWALNNIDIKTDWTLRLDADEYLEEKLVDEINMRINILIAAFAYASIQETSAKEALIIQGTDHLLQELEYD